MKLDEILTGKREVKKDEEMEFWYGIDYAGNNVTIHENDLVTILDDHFQRHDLVEHCRENAWVELPDKTRLVCSLKAAEDKKWNDIYDVLKQFYK